MNAERTGMMRSRERGVTLLELMAVIVIIGILASIAIPSYRTYLLRAQRTDATAALLRAAAAQEKCYLQNNRYATNAELPAGRQQASASSRDGARLLHRWGSPGRIPPWTSLRTATPVGSGPQPKDSHA